ncbi:sigma-70 family RNA polymerase sigma factor [Conexibacter sp. DBS9H8]|uniref:sigma-70 family RNA polymerase sigma factor n=1 Tax=Conexibacter sp. DBS9H8 TaxID=2937801 RepID=UPI00201050BA|nr:sigma-70 family RNA polymerase sigma factor [Conexibacter sp. DBS9H8]
MSSHDEIADLYPRLAPQLRRILGRRLQAPDALMEDACQQAWEALLRHGEHVRAESRLPWLVTTARREALTLLSRQRVELPSDPFGGPPPEPAGGRQLTPRPLRPLPLASRVPGPAEAAELRDRMMQLSHLPRRQQHIIWMRGLGFGYREISLETGATERTVERQITAARRRLRAAA